jgi:hypothetical protein
VDATGKILVHLQQKRNQDNGNHSHRLLSCILRDEPGSCRLADVRRCRFMADVPLAPWAARDIRGAVSPLSTPVVVDERGRVEDDTSFGRLEFPLRVTPLGEPEVRFLKTDEQRLGR